MGKQQPQTNLITSNGFALRFLPSIGVALYVTHCAPRSVPIFGELLFTYYQLLLDKMMCSAHSWAWWSMFGLLSSSCCALQLIINLFNFGCVGFNTYLGPLRPMLLALTVALQTKMWALALPNVGLPSTPWYFLPGCVFSTCLTAFLSLLPELLHLRNGSSAPVDHKGTTVTLALQGVGCVACTTAIKNALGDPSLLIAGLSLSLEREEACATLSCDAATAKETVVPMLIKKIEEAGFEASVKSIAADKDGSGGDQAASKELEADSGSVGGLQSFTASLVAGLCGSSCCLLQLFLNFLASLDVLHIGCAGFNKVLGPWRLHIRCVTLAWMAYSWRLSLKKACCSKSRLVLNTAICVAVMMLPEFLKLSGGPALAPPTVGATVLKLNITGMGCEACETHIQGVMERSSGVIASHVDFTTGLAEMEVAPGWKFNLTEMAAKLQYDGYEILGHNCDCGNGVFSCSCNIEDSERIHHTSEL